MSSSYFKTFAEISNNTSDLLDRLPNAERYFAHLHDLKEPELLSAHVRLVGAYALKLVNAHNLDDPVNRLIRPLTKYEKISNSNDVGNFIKTLFWDAILFHDHGKINENFQHDRMQNSHFPKNINNKIGNRHSVLSAYIFIAEHLDQIAKTPVFTPNEKNFLSFIVYLLAGVILKHHASYYEHEINIPQDWWEALHLYLKKLNIHADSQIVQNGLKALQDEEYFFRLTDEFLKDISPFPLFALLRLCYSLLTASDYYATNEYVTGISVNDFGLLTINRKKELHTAFKHSKNYNAEFFRKQEYYRSLPWDSLNERNSRNLNKLRQKLMAEVLDTVKQHGNEYVFYLEAPTGSGKTNLSLAIALELMKSHNEISKIFYVFPFTTLITQTAQSIKETLMINNAQMIQLHSRSGFHSKFEESQDGQYGNQYLNYVDNLFVNYPITLMTHIKFFNILKSTGKENIYLFHRLANAVVIIDELQSYAPEEWDKIKFFISNYAYLFNTRFILMSATLPKLDALNIPGTNELQLVNRFASLLPNAKRYFQNPNFKGRVEFDFSLFDRDLTIDELADFVYRECEQYAIKNKNRVKGIIEFIFKKRAGEFYRLVNDRFASSGYQVFLLSGTILEPRRKEIIDYLKSVDKDQGNAKVLLITTQVVEAGVDIDMDIGFKDRSLIDSDEQLAGRVNRNARPKPAKVYLFKLDKAYAIYGKDLRYKLTRDELSIEEYQNILINKRFDLLYQKVCDYINRENTNEFIRGIRYYSDHFKKLRFSKIDREFQLISEQSETIYIPIRISKRYFSKEHLLILDEFLNKSDDDEVDGHKVWEVYQNILENKELSFLKKRIDLKKIYGIMSLFMISVVANSKILNDLKRYADLEKYDKYKILYLSHWEEIYDYYAGINEEKLKDSLFL